MSSKPCDPTQSDRKRLSDYWNFVQPTPPHPVWIPQWRSDVSVSYQLLIAYYFPYLPLLYHLTYTSPATSQRKVELLLGKGWLKQKWGSINARKYTLKRHISRKGEWWHEVDATKNIKGKGLVARGSKGSMDWGGEVVLKPYITIHHKLLPIT